jgi:ribosomal-protein-alanine N-acetyltransferase
VGHVPIMPLESMSPEDSAERSSGGAPRVAAMMAGMTITSQAWQHPDLKQSQLRLVEVPQPVLHALARGEAVDTSEYPMTPYLRGEQCVGLWRMRSRPVADAPMDVPWVTRFVVVPGVDAPVGLAGFHGRPDEVGMVEIGYRIDPEQRRKGYARQALETLLAIDRAHPDVHVVRATISPDNYASRSLVESYGFEDVGEQWDEDDGLEIVFEAAADGARLPASAVR